MLRRMRNIKNLNIYQGTNEVERRDNRTSVSISIADVRGKCFEIHFERKDIGRMINFYDIFGLVRLSCQQNRSKLH